MSRGRRFGLGVAGLLVVGGLVGCTGDDGGPTTEGDSPTGSVEAPAIQSDGGSDGSSPGTLVVGGDPSGAEPGEGEGTAAPEGQAPDVSVVPPPEDGSTPTSTGSGANPPDVSTQPSG